MTILSPPAGKLSRVLAYLNRRWVKLSMLASGLMAGAMITMPPEYSDELFALVQVGANQSLAVQTVVMPIARLEEMVVPPAIEIAAADIAKGMVDVGLGASMRVTFNTPSGFLLVVNFDQSLIERLDMTVDGLPLTFESPNSQALVRLPPGRQRMIVLGHRLYLARDAKPGVYPWPIAYAVIPPIH